MAASPGEAGHIVQRPHQRFALRQTGEERSQIQKSRHPMEVDELRFRHLTTSIEIKWRAVFAKKGLIWRRRFGVAAMSEIEPESPGVSSDPVDPALRRPELDYPRIAGVFVEDVHPRIIAGTAQAIVKAISGARCSAAVVGRADVQNLHSVAAPTRRKHDRQLSTREIGKARSSRTKSSDGSGDTHRQTPVRASSPTRFRQPR